MKISNNFINLLIIFLCSSFLFVSYSYGKVQENSQSSSIKGNLKVSQLDYEDDKQFEVSVKFSRGLELIQSEEADVYIVATDPNGLTVSQEIGNSLVENSRKFFDVSISSGGSLPSGTYHLSLIATIPGGNPTNTEDWFNGEEGFLDQENIVVVNSNTEESVDSGGGLEDDGVITVDVGIAEEVTINYDDGSSETFITITLP